VGTSLKSLVKPVARGVLHPLGGLALVRHYQRKSFRILMYHRFPEGADTRKTFEAQCAAFRRNYKPVSLSQIAESLASGKPLPPKALAITVDDGYRDFLERGFPMFQVHDLPVTIFVVSDFLDRKSWLWTDAVSYLLASTPLDSFQLALAPDTAAVSLSLQESTARKAATRQIIEGAKKMPNDFRMQLVKRLPELPKKGVEFGAHTKSHPILSRIHDAEEQNLEIGHSKRRVEEELGAKTLHFCYPNGTAEDFNQTSLDCISGLGFRTAVTTTTGFNTLGDSPFLLKRFGMEPGSPLQYALERVEGLAR
jgi:peptidoglycan/xylan/chitin deacetylase (PgdA/CDA1 family)